MAVEKDLLKEYQAGNRDFTAEEWKEVAQLLFDSQKAIESGKASAEAQKHGMTADEFQQTILSATDALRNSPEGKAAMNEVLQEKKSDRFAKRYRPFFNAVLAGADIATSLSQIRQSNNASRGLVKPALPSAPSIDPALNDALYRAQTGTYDSARAGAVAKQGILDQYLRDIDVAKTVGGGQSSNFGSLAQVASLRRDQALKGLIPLTDAVRAREEGRVDNLLGVRSNLQQQNFQNRLGLSKLAFDQYNLDAGAVGALGATGRLNLRNSVGSLVNQIPDIAGRIDTQSARKEAPTMFDPKYDKYNQYLNQELNDPARLLGDPSKLKIKYDPYSASNINFNSRLV